MKKTKLSLLVIFSSISFLTQTGFSQSCENFDTLTVGAGVAEQLGGYWILWDINSHDAMVSDSQSNSLDNSFVVDSDDVDLVFQFGDDAIVSGQWLYSHYMYVPTGFTGYFNIQADPTPGVDWNLDIIFNDDGTGEFGTQSTDAFDYAMDTWIFVEINYDLDNGLAEVWFDGVLMTQFDNNITIGGVDYYGYDGGGTPGAYYDDVCFGPGWEISADGCEDFDTLTAGDYVAGQLGGYWILWDSTVNDAMVTDAQSHSPYNSFVVDDGVDLVFQFGNDAIVSGQWLYSHYMYVPTGFSGYFNVQTDPTPGVDWNLDLYFNDGGTGYFGGQSTETFVYDQDTWFKVEIIYNLDAGVGTVYFDGEMVLMFGNALTIGGVDYYGNDGGGTPGAYYDDVCFGPGWPNIGVEDLDMPNLVVYPNPAKDQVRLESESIIDEVRVYNSIGQLVYSDQYGNKQMMVNTSSFIHGMYIVEVKVEGRKVRRKLLVE